MDADTIKRLEEVFQGAVELPRVERDRFIEERCAGDGPLRICVDRLLENHSRGMGGFLDEPIVAASCHDLEAVVATPPARIGPYEIAGVLGEGGMGVVYEARQENPRRNVALKVIRPGLASSSVLRRFRREADLLGQLQHPGIACIYEAGTASLEVNGAIVQRPFFAMELVKGRPLTEHARKHSLDVNAKLEVFARICDAAHHAHGRGVVHRDLKPGNVLVDESGQPKILDFGVARATDADVHATSLRTDAGQLIGTLSYMSPEQVGRATDHIDARSDVYSLGVMLYQLLASRMPLDLDDCTIADAVRVIQEFEPAGVGTIDTRLRGDIDTIVSRAIAKDWNRRYQSAALLAMDIRHYLRGEPIEARRDSALYMLRKNLRRYRWAVAAFLVFVVGLSAFSLYAGVQAGRYGRLALLERKAREQSVAAQRQAVEQRELAVAEAQRAKNVTAFLEDTFGLANPDITQSPGLTMTEMLDQASKRIDESFAGQPEAEAAIRTAIGRAYASMGDPDSAFPHLYRAMHVREYVIDAAPEELYETLWTLSTARALDLGDRWRWRHRTAFDLARRIIAVEHEPIASALATAWTIASDPANRESVGLHCDNVIRLASERLAPDDNLWTYLGDVLFALGLRLEEWDRLDLADAYFGGSLEIHRRFHPETHTGIARALGKLSECYVVTGRHEEGEDLAREALNLLAQLLPEDHWYIAVNQVRLASSIVAQGRYAEAKPLLLNAGNRITEALGEENAWSITVLKSVVRLYEEWGKLTEASRYRDRLAVALAGTAVHEISLADLRMVLDPRHDELLAAMEELALAVDQKPDDAEGAFAPVLNACSQFIPDDDPRLGVIAECIRHQVSEIKREPDSREFRIRMYAKVIAMFRASTTTSPLRLATALAYQASIYEGEGVFDLGEEAAREGLALRKRHGASPGLIANAKSILGGCLTGQGRFAEAQPLVTEGFQGLLEARGSENGLTRKALGRLKTLYQRWGQMSRAYPYLGPILTRAIERANNANALEDASWAIVAFPGFDQEAYQQALEAARMAFALVPTDAAILNTRGVAEYRCGRYAAALETLTRSTKLRSQTSYADLAFLAMTHQRLGLREEARAQLRQLRELRVARPALDDHPEYRRFLREAEALIAPV